MIYHSKTGVHYSYYVQSRDSVTQNGSRLGAVIMPKYKIFYFLLWQWYGFVPAWQPFASVPPEWANAKFEDKINIHAITNLFIFTSEKVTWLCATKCTLTHMLSYRMLIETRCSLFLLCSIALKLQARKRGWPCDHPLWRSTLVLA